MSTSLKETSICTVYSLPNELQETPSTLKRGDASCNYKIIISSHALMYVHEPFVI